MIQHDPRCDQRHTPRQRCNRRMTPAARLARLAAEETVAEPVDEPTTLVEVEAREPEPEPEPDLVREAVATIEPLEPTVFVSREWNDTAAAVEQAYRPPATPPSRPAEQPDPARSAALIGLALALVLLLMLRLARGRQ